MVLVLDILSTVLVELFIYIILFLCNAGNCNHKGEGIDQALFHL